MPVDSVEMEGLKAAEIAEIEALFDEHKIVSPKHVLERSRDPSSALHARFLWGDDSEAARRWRVEQARSVIRAVVIVAQRPGSGETLRVRAYTSLRDDRGEGGGYRRTRDVLTQADLAAMALADARRDFALFRRKHEHLRALRDVFAAADAVFAEAEERAA